MRSQSYFHPTYPRAIYWAVIARRLTLTSVGDYGQFVLTDQIVDEVCEGPNHGNADEGNTEQDDVQEADAQDVRQPDSPAVHHAGVGVHLAVCRAHIHGGGATSKHATYWGM